MRFEQYEIWVQRGNRWEMSSSYLDFEIASAVAYSYNNRVRLIQAVYENGTCVKQDVLAEVGMPRTKP
jgi:hypothetical protein